MDKSLIIFEGGGLRYAYNFMQIVSLLESENPDEYMDPSTRNKKYSLLEQADVALLLEKYVSN